VADDSNSMQDSMGLSPQPTAVYGSPTQPVQIPQTKHPGQISAELTQQSQAQIANAAVMTRMNNLQTGGIFNPAFAGGVGGGGSTPLGTFGNQYAANSSMLASGHFGAYGPTAYGMMPQPGFNMGMMPMAGAVTDPAMGIYRNRLSTGGGVPVMPNLPRESLLHGPFYQPPPPALFNTAMGQAMDMGTVRGAQYQGAFSAGVGVSARTGTDLIGGFIGGGLGALTGGIIGGPVGAKIGGTLGSAGGFFGMDAIAGQAAGQAALSNPVSNAAQRAAQMQGIANNFLVTGANLSPSGRGLDTGSATNLQRFIAETGYRGTASGFNPADLTKIMDVSSRNGLMDATQNVGDIKGRVTSIASALRQFMQVANEPDVVNAIKELGTMRNMGFSLGEANTAAQNARTYARMAGTTMRAIGEVGQAGAYTYQGYGLSAGLGSQMAMGGAALARQGVAAGTFTEQQLAMLGGTAGIGQRHAEMAASVLRIPMVAGSVSQMRPDGGFGINKDLLADLASGRMDINGMARSASSNLAAAAARGGPGAIGMYMMQQNELQDQVGRALGPEGSQLMMMQQIQATAKMMGLKGPGGMATAAMTMFKGDPDAARQAVQLMSNPEYFKGLQRQVDVSRSEKSAENYAAVKKAREADSFTAKMGRPFRGLSDAFNTGGSYIDAASDTISQYFAEAAEDSANAEKGLTTGHFNADLLGMTAAERKNIDALSASDIEKYGDTDISLAASSGSNYSDQTLFGDTNMLNYVREKDGSYNNMAFRGTRRLLNAFGFQQGGPILTALGYETHTLDESAANYDEGAIASGEIMNTSEEKRDAAYSDLVKKYGSKAKADEVIKAYGAKLRGVAKSKEGFWGRDESMGGKDYGAINTALRADYGMDASTASLVRKAGGLVISAGVSQKVLDTSTKAAAQGAADASAMNDAAEEDVEKLGDEVFSDWGSDEEHSAGLQAIFGDNTDMDAAVLASLMETAENGNLTGTQKASAQLRIDEYAKHHNIGVRDAAYKNARALRTRLGQDPTQKRMLRYMGQKLVDSGVTADKMRDRVTGQGKQYLADKAKLALVESGKTLLAEGGASSTIIAGLGKSLTEMIKETDKAGGSGSFKQGSHMAAVYKKYEDAMSAAGSDFNKQEEARTELKNALSSYAPISASKTRGNYDNGDFEGTMAGIAEMAESMSKEFPQAIGTFQKSSDAMLVAAQLLIKYAEAWQGRTRLGPPGY